MSQYAESLALCAKLGRINADDGKMLPTHFVDAGTDDSVGFLHRLLAARPGILRHSPTSSDVVGHLESSVIGESEGVDLKLSLIAIPDDESLEKRFFSF